MQNQNNQNQQEQSTKSTKTPKIGFISLGCPKALVDSEDILTQIKNEGYLIVSEYNQADLVIINTCGFIDSAITESLDAIGEALKENGKVIVTGCLGAKSEQILSKYPNVLAVTGPHSLDLLMSYVHQHLPKPQQNQDQSQNQHQQSIGVKLTPKHYAYLKISEGCNQSCTFCIIPSMRGKHDSYPVNKILNQAKNLKINGVKELLIVSQDTSAYGVDVKYKLDFWDGKPIKTRILELCEQLSEISKTSDSKPDSRMWIRLHYIYPYPHVDALIPLMRDGKILPYLDIPLQHASSKILKLMKRPANMENMVARIKKWREICPEIIIRSTFIIGFPGETDEDFEDLLSFLKEVKLNRVGAFLYSAVQGAKANDLPGIVADDVKEKRLEKFMEVQEQISSDLLSKRIGTYMQVLVDSYDYEENCFIARSYADSPDIDGVVIIEDHPYQNQEDISHISHLIGNFVNVKIIDASSHDLYAKII